MPRGGSVTGWIEQLRAGDSLAAQHLWERYFERLVRLARKKLQGARRVVADEEDVALSAFDSFCRGLEQGRFPQLHDRNNLWGLLLVITARKALDLRHHERRQRRGAGAVRGESALLSGLGADLSERGFDQVIGREPTPEFAVLMAEQCQRLLGMLDDEGLRSLAVCKLEGYSNEESAAKLGWALRTVERKLSLIRSIWAQEVTP